MEQPIQQRKDSIFRDMNDVKPPCAVAGGEAECLSNGKWIPCNVHKVELRRISHLRQWAWFYGVTVVGEQVACVHMVRYGWEMRAKAVEIRGF